MSKQSAGVMAYRFVGKQLQVLLVHPGGPFFVRKDDGVWSVPKGEYQTGEDPVKVAGREFTEETGNKISLENYISLSPVKNKGGKTLHIYAIEADFEKCFISSNEFEMEWPPRSGIIQRFPEIDRAEWFELNRAEKKIFPSQLPLLHEIGDILQYRGFEIK